MSWDARTTWQRAQSQPVVQPGSVFIGDVDGVPGDDIVRFVRENAISARWEVSSGGAGPWIDAHELQLSGHRRDRQVEPDRGAADVRRPLRRVERRRRARARVFPPEPPLQPGARRPDALRPVRVLALAEASGSASPAASRRPGRGDSSVPGAPGASFRDFRRVDLAVTRRRPARSGRRDARLLHAISAVRYS